MFRAIDSLTGDSVVSLDSRWDVDVDPLRKRCQKDKVLCPECKQAVRLRAGRIRRRHFAHQSRSDCPLSFESPEVLAARAMLYRFLQVAFGDQVSIEEPISDGSNERADCVVTLETGKAAYFIVPRQITRERDAFIKRREKAYRHIHWVLMPRLLKKAPGKDKEFLLSTTPRDLTARAGAENLYPAGHHTKLGSLYYLYAKHERLVVLRGLRCVHEPNVFRMARGLKLDLEHVIADARTGQLMSAQERDELVEWQKAEATRKKEEAKLKREAEAREHKRLQERAAEMQAMKEAAAKARKKEAAQAHARVAERSEKSYGRKKAESPASPREARALNCLECGNRVTEWIYEQFDGCLCKRCYQGPATLDPAGQTPHTTPASATSSEAPSRKEFRCLRCGTATRDWVHFAYPSEYPKGICICTSCHNAGLEFPYDEPSP